MTDIIGLRFLKNIISKYGQIVVYGISLSLLLFLLDWLQWKFIIINHSTDIYIGLIALFFTLLGVWIARQLTKSKTKTIIVEKKVLITPVEEFVPNETELKKLDLTKREWEVLQLMATGKSNNEIAEELFLSVSTIKTHASNIFVKMAVKSRTQAMEKAKRLKIVH